jgi:DDE superfamily endonuclease/Helix-turn-helix of DDE superfamily endonuclease
MITYHNLQNKPQLLRHLSGLNWKAFHELLPVFRAAYQQDLVRRDQSREKVRQRQAGGGQKGAMPTLEDKLVFILVYFRHYPVQILQGVLFGMGQPQANEWMQRLTPILHEALGYACQLPARQSHTITEVLTRCPGLEFIIDGSERAIRRPTDPLRQKANYSGKKKRHTVKNVVISDKRTGKIKALSATVAGKTHDKKIADEQDIHFPSGSCLWKDTGFQGYEPPTITTRQPRKKPKGGQLSPAEKDRNRLISRERIGIEHSLGGVKVFGIVHDIFRNLREGFADLVMAVACGLHNVRIDHPLKA